MPAEHPDVRPGLDLGQLRQVRARDYLIRFAFGATISVVAALISSALGARFGGLFLAFPAILPASLTLIQEDDGSRDADRDAVGAVLGGLALVVFAVVGEGLFGRLPAAVVLAGALTAWAVVAVGLYRLLAFLRPDDCDRAQD